MFDWCQKVNIQIVENHYHYYEGMPPATTQHKNSKLAQMKAEPIAVSSLMKEKYQSRSSSKNNITHQTPAGIPPQQVDLSEKKNLKQSRIWSWLYPEDTWEFKSQANRFQSSDHATVICGKVIGLQGLSKKQKPKMVVGKGQEFYHQCDDEGAKNTPSTLTEGNLQKNGLIVSSKVMNQNQATTNANFNSKKDSDVSNSIHLGGSKDSSLFRLSKSKQSAYPNNSLHILEPIHRQTLSSMNLTHILQKQQTYLPQNNHNSLKVPAKKITLWPDTDRHTLVSRENEDSESSFIIQESFICDHETSQNFKVIEQKKLTQGGKTLKLGLQINVNCFVSIKEMDFSDMQNIAAEMQAYEVVASLIDKNCFRNILQLYQMQMSKGSYLLIKQPFTSTLVQYLAKLPSKPAQQTAISQFQHILQSILSHLAKMGIYPTRLIEPEDCVQCLNTIKLHNMCLFRQSQQPKYQIIHIVSHLRQALQMRVTKC